MHGKRTHVEDRVGVTTGHVLAGIAAAVFDNLQRGKEDWASAHDCYFGALLDNQVPKLQVGSFDFFPSTPVEPMGTPWNCGNSGTGFELIR